MQASVREPKSYSRSPEVRQSLALERATVTIRVDRALACGAIDPNGWARNACINGLFGAAAIEVSTTVVTRARATIEVCAAINFGAGAAAVEVCAAIAFGAGAAAIHDQIAALPRAPITVAVDQPNPRGAPNYCLRAHRFLVKRLAALGFAPSAIGHSGWATRGEREQRE